ncbi:MAG: hypothetical protein J0J10_11445 [Bosea sp.]|jgi:hypothetical protein|uniref:hypothetical protein n=1 Tax=Bosea sp. (in: a-proteobacteria) TaxID=1871050 RepID=UPI001ACEA2C3|nr:hypothetical protein [Bosea sp. (in: a-proteobacteria)]MBN9469376.1 hypothetical protein [Bosea sp. (in: a-proteobacteria)]
MDENLKTDYRMLVYQHAMALTTYAKMSNTDAKARAIDLARSIFGNDPEFNAAFRSPEDEED